MSEDKRDVWRRVRVCALVLTNALVLLAPERVPAQSQTLAATDSAAVVTVVEQFHAALAAGDSTTALSLLAPDVIILEAGGIETREQYRAHHLASDIAFAKAVQSRRTLAGVTVRGDVAWAVSESVAQGTFRDRAVDSMGAELMVLARAGSTWKIAAIHWSSRQRRR